MRRHILQEIALLVHRRRTEMMLVIVGILLGSTYFLRAEVAPPPSDDIARQLSSKTGFPVVRIDIKECEMTFAITYTQECDTPQRIKRSDTILDLTSVGSVHAHEKDGLGVVSFDGLDTFLGRLPLRSQEEYFYCDGTSFDGKEKLGWLYPTRSPLDMGAIASLETYIDTNCR